MLTVSVVSHGQAELVSKCLRDLSDFPEVNLVVLTLNIPEDGVVVPASLMDKIVLVENKTSRGFGTNHNAAFAYCKTPYFCVINPDVRCFTDPFLQLLKELGAPNVAVIAPAVIAPDGALEDSARHFPSPLSLFFKAIGLSDGRYQYEQSEAPFEVDWVGGMFMLFNSDDYRSVKGFDESFFLYYEDVDICARLWKSKRRVLVCPKTQVIHDAQRASRHNFRHLRWHVISLLRYLSKHWLRLPKCHH
jgi:GT2 family glycosyltransferase